MFLTTVALSSSVEATQCCNSDSHKFELRLTDAFAVNTIPYASGGISEKGDLVLLGYTQIPVTNTSLLAMELFQNQNGQLNSIGALPLDPFEINGGAVDSVAVSKDFKYFAVLDDDRVSTLRLRLFKRSSGLFVLLDTLVFSDFDPSVNFRFFTFTDDRRSIALSYGTTSSTPNNPETVLRLIDVATFNVTSSDFVSGISNGPVAFTLSNNNFILFSFSGLANNLFQPFSVLSVYEIKFGQLILIDQDFLPQFAPSYFASSPHCSNSSNIIVGTHLALQPFQTSIFQLTQNAHTFLLGDTNNLREYSFDGSFLSLSSKTSIDSPFLLSNFYRDGKTFALSKGTNETNVGIPDFLNQTSFLTTVCDDSRKVFSCTGPIITTPLRPFFFRFSGNGKWAIVAGGAMTGINNVNLYLITDERPCCCNSNCGECCQ